MGGGHVAMRRSTPPSPHPHTRPQSPPPRAFCIHCRQAKDNAKYLSTLDGQLACVYGKDPAAIMDALPALMSNLRMVHTIARHFATSEHMTDLLVRLTRCMITACAAYVRDVGSEEAGGGAGDSLWRKEVAPLISRLEVCLRLNELYHESYRLTREKLAGNPSGRQFDFDERAIFAPLDGFCRRCMKLIDLFGTVRQYTALAEHQLEGLAPLLTSFNRLVAALQARRHDLLDYRRMDFDRDYVEFNANIDALERKLQAFMDEAFATIKAVDVSLALLGKFEEVLRKESLTAELANKAHLLFAAFGRELEIIQALYEDQKSAPPRPRNMPPVAGNLLWARNLLARAQRVMAVFESKYSYVFTTRDGKAVVRQYNRIAAVLVAFEIMWTTAWLDSIPAASAGLQACVLVRLEGRLYVNFDAEVLQLVREAKALSIMGVAMPPSLQAIASREESLKRWVSDLAACIADFDRIRATIPPVLANLLAPAVNDVELRLRPGMTSITWTSMNVDMFRSHVSTGVRKLDELVRNVLDVLQNRM